MITFGIWKKQKTLHHLSVECLEHGGTAQMFSWKSFNTLWSSTQAERGITGRTCGDGGQPLNPGDLTGVQGWHDGRHDRHHPPPHPLGNRLTSIIHNADLWENQGGREGRLCILFCFRYLQILTISLQFFFWFSSTDHTKANSFLLRRVHKKNNLD